MKHMRWITLILMAALLSACAPAAASETPASAVALDTAVPAATDASPAVEPADAYPAPLAVATLSGYPAPVELPVLPGYPAPGEAGLPETCRPVGMLTFVDPAGRFCFAYPADFTLDADREGSPVLEGPALDSGNVPSARMLMFGTLLADGQDLDSVADGLAVKYSQENPQLEVVKGDAVFGGEAAISLEPVPGEAGSRDYVIVHGNEVITLRFEPNVESYPAARMDRDALIDIVLRSFAWLK